MDKEYILKKLFLENLGRKGMLAGGRRNIRGGVFFFSEF